MQELAFFCGLTLKFHLHLYPVVLIMDSCTHAFVTIIKNEQVDNFGNTAKHETSATIQDIASYYLTA